MQLAVSLHLRHLRLVLIPHSVLHSCRNSSTMISRFSYHCSYSNHFSGTLVAFLGISPLNDGVFKMYITPTWHITITPTLCLREQTKCYYSSCDSSCRAVYWLHASWLSSISYVDDRKITGGILFVFQLGGCKATMCFDVVF
jgi:hypothetical protein